MGMAALHLSAGGFLEALGGALVRFHLRHKISRWKPAIQHLAATLSCNG
jgi:hypothetical protein